VVDNGRGFLFGADAIYADYTFLILLIDLLQQHSCEFLTLGAYLVKGGSNVGPFIGAAFILNAVLAGDFTTPPSTQTKHVHP
jgi:hypothetical protein